MRRTLKDEIWLVFKIEGRTGLVQRVGFELTNLYGIGAYGE
jgi:hypothetical protein